MCRMILAATIIAFLCVVTLNGFCQVEVPFNIQPFGSATIRVTTSRITNLVFPGPIKAGVKVSNDILVQKVKGIDNVVEIKAMRGGFSPTSVSLFSRSGRIYSFLVVYSDTAGQYDFSIIDTIRQNGLGNSSDVLVMAGMPVSAERLKEDEDALKVGGFLRRTQEYEKVRLRLRGIYVRDSLLWFVFDLRNRSLVPYKADYLRVYSTEKNKVNRTASHESDIDPKYVPGLPVAESRQIARFCVAFTPFTLSRIETLNVELGEANGGRTIKMIFSPKILLKARQ